MAGLGLSGLPGGTAGGILREGLPCSACTEPGFWDSSALLYRWMGVALIPALGPRACRGSPLRVALGIRGAAVAAAAGTTDKADVRMEVPR